VTRKLDLARDYATVHGSDVVHRFEQDGMVFDAQGNEIAPEKPAKTKRNQDPTEPSQ
jgi:hypothetical protein